jgi:hypothetical protein
MYPNNDGLWMTSMKCQASAKDLGTCCWRGKMHSRNKMISRRYFERLLLHWRLYEELPYETRMWASTFKSVQSTTSRQLHAQGLSIVVLDDIAHQRDTEERATQPRLPTFLLPIYRLYYP